MKTTYRLLAFCSSDHPETCLHPKLEITYEMGVIVESTPSDDNRLFIYPNPNDGNFIVDVPADFNAHTLQVYDEAGRIVHTESLKGRFGQIALVLNVATGSYYVAVSNKAQRMVKKLVKE